MNYILYDKNAVKELNDWIAALNKDKFISIEQQLPKSMSNKKKFIEYLTLSFKLLFKRPGSVRKVVAWQQMYGLGLSLLNRILPLQPKMNITVMMFIFKPKTGLKGTLYHWAVKRAITSKRVKKILVYSSSELQHCSQLFPRAASKFVYIPFPIWEIKSEVKYDGDYYFATGRSNRDYDFLIELFKRNGRKLIIACDQLMPDLSTENITILNNCFGQKMIDMLASAQAALVPLKDTTISSGQLVALQAMKLGVPVIATDVGGVRDYITHGENGLLAPNKFDEWENAISRIENDANIREQIIGNAHRRIERDHTIPSFAKKVAEITVGT